MGKKYFQNKEFYKSKHKQLIQISSTPLFLKGT